MLWKNSHEWRTIVPKIRDMNLGIHKSASTMSTSVQLSTPAKILKSVNFELIWYPNLVSFRQVNDNNGQKLVMTSIWSTVWNCFEKHWYWRSLRVSSECACLLGPGSMIVDLWDLCPHTGVMKSEANINAMVRVCFMPSLIYTIYWFSKISIPSVICGSCRRVLLQD